MEYKQVDIINKTVALIEKKNAEITHLLNKIVEGTDQLTDTALDAQDKGNLVLKVEYLLFRLRVLVSAEQSTVKQILTSDIDNPGLSYKFKQRDLYLAAINQRLTELRDDIDIIQKMLYTQTRINMR